MNKRIQTLVVVPIFLVVGSPTIAVRAQVSEYTDETTFRADLATQGYVAVQEGFEDDGAWGTVRSTIPDGEHTAPSITNLGITWSSNNTVSEVTTGPGPALTGNWGFFVLPHGDYPSGITDGWVGTGEQPLVAIGGWITGTFGGRINFILDGDEQDPADFGGDNAMGGGHRFLGVISPAGFSTFEIRETEGTIGDQKFIFADDLTFAFGGTIADCNQNTIADALDIANQTSDDCNNNLVPDECEIDVNSPAPGGPFYCLENCDPDCNVNGILDACEVVMPLDFASRQLSPIGQGSPQSFTIVAPPVSRADVVLDYAAYANLGGGPDYISVDINGVPVGTLFGPNGSDCPELQPDSARLIVPMATFNNAVNGGDAVINMVASAEVDPFGCDPNTYITVDVRLFVASGSDLNENGVLDECEVDIPTVSAWGMVVMTLLVFAAGTITLWKRGMRPGPNQDSRATCGRSVL
ncbi:MAG: hypothetical protein PVI86_18905 [Phycisphaerae bacterium]|jgi:hypothetical protein